MLELLLTQNSTFIIGPIAKLLGFIMQGIFWLLDKVGIQNIGLAIIIFTLVIYLCLMPLTIKQQKFSKMSAIMNPELQAIQAKYKGAKDQDSMMKMQEETKAVYAKYGVSPSGSCLQLLIQMPILFALYRVIYNIPAYVPQVKQVYMELVPKLTHMNGPDFWIRSHMSSAKMFAKQFTNLDKYPDLNNTVIDVLNRATKKDWNALSNKYSNLSNEIDATTAKLNHYNNFLGINIAFSPWEMIKEQFASTDGRNWWIIIGAVLIPILSAVTQWINIKLTPQNNTNNQGQDSMGSTMKMMNSMMPLMSAFFCTTLPAGMGLYWIAGSVIRSIQQIVINRHIDKMNLDEIIKNNTAKYEEKLKKKGVLNDNISKKINASSSNRTVKEAIQKTDEERKAEIAKAQEYLKKTEKKKSSGGSSLADKANMVKRFNEQNNK